MKKTTQSLNGKWLIQYDPSQIGLALGWEKPESNRDGWHLVNVPTFWDDMNYDGIGWFVRSFYAESAFRNKKIALVFDSVDDNATVFLNGEQIYEHTGSGVQFYVDISNKLKFDQENTLVVRVEDTGGAGGINGDVYLQTFENETELLMTEYFRKETIPIPEWVRDAVIYELYVRIYSREGNFKSVTADLPRLKNLGVNCIWLMPIFPIGMENRKGSLGSPYAICEFKEVNPEYGTTDDFKALINEAHRNGIRVIVDIACNHTAWDNPLIRDHPEWYTQDKKGRIISPNGNWTDVADLNYDNRELWKYMIGVLEYWVRDFDIDGYRLDVAELVPYDFWEEALPRLQKIKPDVLMLAEGEHPRLHTTAFHLTYAWNTRYILHKILTQHASASDLFADLEKEYYRYPKNYLRMRFTENHDQPRSIDYLGRKQSDLAAVIIFTIPGVPMIYNGQEIGESIKPSLFDKSEILWEIRDRSFTNLFSELIRLRQEYPAIRRGTLTSLTHSASQSVTAFTRHGIGISVLVVANMTDKAQSTSLPLRDIMKNALGKEIVRKIGDADFTIAEDEMTIRLKPYGFGIFEIR